MSKTNTVSFFAGLGLMAALSVAYVALAGPPNSGGNTTRLSGSDWTLKMLDIPYGDPDMVSIRRFSPDQEDEYIKVEISYKVQNGLVCFNAVPTEAENADNLAIQQLISSPDGTSSYTFDAEDGEIHLTDMPVEHFINLSGNHVSWNVRLLAADGSKLWGWANDFTVR